MHGYDEDERDLLIVRRAMILRAAPVARGDFDRSHLQAIHAFLFEPCAGTNYRPGQIRVESGGRAKDREDTYYTVFYSKMDAAAVKRLDTALEKMRPERLAGMQKRELVKEFSQLYAELDYIHPFYEGNSRTLRELFSQCAEEVGFVFDTSKLLENGIEELYAARDKAVLQKALGDIPAENESRRERIQTALNWELKYAPSLEDLFASCCRKMNMLDRAKYQKSLEQAAKSEIVPKSREKIDKKIESFKRLTKECEIER